MVQTPIRFKKGIAIELRKQGLSYSEIKNSINIPKSTIAYWLKNVPLSEIQVEKLKTRRSETAKLNSEKRISKILKTIEDVKKSSAKNIKKISKRELWLMGIILYWREKNKNDFRKGVYFSSSNPALIKFFLKWLKEIGKIKDEEILFDIFIKQGRKNKNKNISAYWSGITGFPEEYFSRVYAQREAIRKRKITPKEHQGFLRIRVRASSMLARQISGWIEGIMLSFY